MYKRQVNIESILPTSFSNAIQTLNQKNEIPFEKIIGFGKISSSLPVGRMLYICNQLNADASVLPIPRNAREAIDDASQKLGWEPRPGLNFFQALESQLPTEISLSCGLRDHAASGASKFLAAISNERRREIAAEIKDCNYEIISALKAKRVELAVEYHCRFHEAIFPNGMSDLQRKALETVLMEITPLLIPEAYGDQLPFASKHMLDLHLSLIHI